MLAMTTMTVIAKSVRFMEVKDCKSMLHSIFHKEKTYHVDIGKKSKLLKLPDNVDQAREMVKGFIHNKKITRYEHKGRCVFDQHHIHKVIIHYV